MFLTAELISGQIEKIKKIAISDRAKTQPVASELPCFYSTDVISAQSEKILKKIILVTD